MNKLTWLISLIPPVVSLIIIRTYLGYFDNGSLFAENLSLAGIFSYVFIFIVLTTIGFALVFFLPSLLFCLSIPKSANSIHNYRDIKGLISLASLIAFPLAVFPFFLWAFLSTEYPAYSDFIGWFFSLAVLIMVFLTNYYFLRKALKIAQEYQNAKTRRITACWIYIGSPLLILTIIFCYTFCISTIIRWVDTQVAGESILTLAKLAGLISILGILLMLPGTVYVNTDHTVRSESWHIKFSLVSVSLWLLITSIYVSSFYPVLIDKTMVFAGISDWKTRTFQIEANKFPVSNFSNHDWNVSNNLQGKYFTVQGVMVYSLNNIRLLCPESVRERYKQMLQFIPWDRNSDKNRAAELKKAAARCQPFVHGGISRLAEN